MEICPHCRSLVDPMEHIFFWLDMSQIHCPCGYVGLPVDMVKKEADSQPDGQTIKKRKL